MSETIAVVGLGNPGRRYAATRHNVGYEVIAALAERWDCSPKSGKGDYLVASCRFGEVPVLLAQPTTFMNHSGHAVQALLSFYGIDPERLLVVLDDFNLPLGSIRIRPGGTSGGHRGLEHIILQLGRDDFTRLRIGVGSETMPDDRRGFVTDRFTESERPVIEEAVTRAAEAVEILLSEGTDAAMNRFN